LGVPIPFLSNTIRLSGDTNRLNSNFPGCPLLVRCPGIFTQAFSFPAKNTVFFDTENGVVFFCSMSWASHFPVCWGNGRLLMARPRRFPSLLEATPFAKRPREGSVSSLKKNNCPDWLALVVLCRSLMTRKLNKGPQRVFRPHLWFAIFCV